MLLVVPMVAAETTGDITLRLGGRHHHLADFVGGIRRFNALELRLFHCRAEGELRALRLLGYMMVIFLWVLLVLVLEAGRGMATFLRADAHIMQFRLFSRHKTAITFESSHGGLGAAMESRSSSGLADIGALMMSDDDASLLCRGQLMDEATRR